MDEASFHQRPGVLQAFPTLGGENTPQMISPNPIVEMAFDASSLRSVS